MRRQKRCVVEGKAVNAGAVGLIDDLWIEGAMLLEWPVRRELKSHSTTMKGLETVDGAENIRVELWRIAVHDFVDKDLVDQLTRAWQHLATAAQSVGFLGTGSKRQPSRSSE